MAFCQSALLGSEPRRLHRALNEQAVAPAALGCASDLAAAPEQIGLLAADEALAGGGFSRSGGEFGGEAEFGEGGLQPFVDAAVALRWLQANTICRL